MSAPMRQVLKSLFARSLLFGAFWLGLVHDVQGAERVGFFTCWLLIVVHVFSASDIAKQFSPHRVLTPIYLSLDIALTLFLVWHDAPVTALAWLFRSCLLAGAQEQYKAGKP